jgi:hypothetical protein
LRERRSVLPAKAPSLRLCPSYGGRLRLVAPLMVNGGMVNGARSGVPHVHFCEFFRDSGLFLRFKNPVNHRLLRELTINCTLRLHAIAATRHSKIRQRINSPLHNPLVIHINVFTRRIRLKLHRNESGGIAMSFAIFLSSFGGQPVTFAALAGVLAMCCATPAWFASRPSAPSSRACRSASWAAPREIQPWRAFRSSRCAAPGTPGFPRPWRDGPP